MIQLSHLIVAVRCRILSSSHRLISKCASRPSMQDMYSGKKQMKRAAEERANRQELDYRSRDQHEERTADSSTTGTHQYDAYTGVKPTNFQRWWLMITRMYPTRADIPEYVSGGALVRLGNRMRIVYITVAVILCFVVFFSFEQLTYKKLLKDRNTLSKEPHD